MSLLASTAVHPAQPRPAALTIGSIALDTPVVLAPMAGITNAAFRRLCREFGAGLYVSEMITSRSLVERTPKSMHLIRHHPSESPRSIQLYGVDPKTVAEAVTMLVAEDRADHIDLNFGCPVPKVTRKGGGAALPWKRGLFRDIVEGAVRAAGRHSAHREDAQGHRLRPPHLPRGGQGGRGRRRVQHRPARPHRRAVLQRPRRLVRDRRAEAGHHQRARCWATATSGPAPTACG